MITVKATEFAKNFRRYKQLAQHEPIKVTSRDAAGVYVISPEEFSRYQSLIGRERQALYLHELPPEELEQILATKVEDPEALPDSLLHE